MRNVDHQAYSRHQNTTKMSPAKPNNQHEEFEIDVEFDMITDKEVEETWQHQARAALGIRPTAGVSGGLIFKNAVRAVALTVAIGATKVAQKMTDKTKFAQGPTPEQALCPCLADPVHGWMSCKIYGHVRAKLKEKRIVTA